MADSGVTAVPEPGPPKSDGGAKTFHCGTLTYTKMGLVGIFGWLLWGDFVFTLMEDVWPQILPLFLLEGLGMQPGESLLIRTTIPQCIGIFLCPIVSFRSDRCRSRWGRRIPYMLFTAPMLSLFLGGLGFSGEIIDWFRLTPIPAKLGFSPMMTTMVVIGFLGAGFSVFNEFVGSVYWYLFNDVVPKEYMGRFLGWFRLIGTGAHMLFNVFVFPYALTHTRWIFLGASILYLVGFGLMCWRVKEGQYPPVTDVTKRTGVIKQIALYFKDCFTHPIYVLLFLSSAFTTVAGLANIGAQVFLLSLGITLALQGYVAAVRNGVSMGLQVPSGWLVDKIHPLPVVLATTAIGIVVAVLQYFFLWGFNSYVVFAAAGLVFGSIGGAAGIPMLMRIFPEQKYGQFCSANGAMRSLAAVAFTPVAIPFVNWMSDYGRYKDGYRIAFLWSAVCSLLSLLCLLGVYYYWKRMGGNKGYVPPLKTTRFADTRGIGNTRVTAALVRRATRRRRRRLGVRI